MLPPVGFCAKGTRFQFVRCMNPFAAVSHISVFISIYESHHSIPQVDFIFSPRYINRLRSQHWGWKHNSGNQKKPPAENKQARTKEFRPAPHLPALTRKFLPRALERSPTGL